MLLIVLQINVIKATEKRLFLRAMSQKASVSVVGHFGGPPLWELGNDAEVVVIFVIFIRLARLDTAFFVELSSTFLRHEKKKNLDRRVRDE